MDTIAAEYGSSDEDSVRHFEPASGPCQAASTSIQSLRPAPFVQGCPGPEASRDIGYIAKRKRRAACPAPCTDSTSTAPNTGAQMTRLSQYLDALLENKAKQSSLGKRKAREDYRLPRKLAVCLKGHTKPVMSVNWHPSDHRLLLSSSFDGNLSVWDALVGNSSSRLVCCGFHRAPVRTASWISRVHTISGGFDKKAIYYDMHCSQPITSFGHKGTVTALEVHPTNANLFSSGDSEKCVQSWDIRSPDKPIAQYFGAGGQILDLAYLNNGQELVASSDIVRKNAASQMLLVWESSKAIVRSNQVYLEPFTCPCLQAHPWDSTFMAQSNAGYIVIFSSSRPYKLNKHKRFEHHSIDGNNAQFDISPDGSLLCSASADGKAYFYDYYNSKMLKTISVSDQTLLGVHWHPSLQSTVALTSWDGSISVLH